MGGRNDRKIRKRTYNMSHLGNFETNSKTKQENFRQTTWLILAQSVYTFGVLSTLIIECPVVEVRRPLQKGSSSTCDTVSITP